MWDNVFAAEPRSNCEFSVPLRDRGPTNEVEGGDPRISFSISAITFGDLSPAVIALGYV